VRPNLAGTSELWFAVGDKICRGAMIRDTAKKDAAEVNSKLAPEADSPVSAPSRETEYALIQRIVHGEKELFYQLVRPYERRVYVMAFAILRNEADAQDAAQDSLFKAFKHLAQFRSEARFSTWLIQVTLNEARMRLRKNHLEIMRPIDEVEQEDGSYTPRDFTDWREIPSEALERKQVREMLVKALASLTEKYREVFVLRDGRSSGNFGGRGQDAPAPRAPDVARFSGSRS
jgi:RNA polymerase sigma-70 factor (ECF subfamily)